MKSIVELRSEKGITQQELAKILGIAESTLSYYETGQRQLPYVTANKIAAILDVRIDEIFLPTRFTVSKIKEKKETEEVPND